MITLGAKNSKDGKWNRARSMQHWSPQGDLVEHTSVYGERRVSAVPAIDHTLKPVREGLATADAIVPEPVPLLA